MMPDQVPGLRVDKHELDGGGPCDQASGWKGGAGVVPRPVSRHR